MYYLIRNGEISVLDHDEVIKYMRENHSDLGHEFLILDCDNEEQAREAAQQMDRYGTFEGDYDPFVVGTDDIIYLYDSPVTPLK